ncbi:MAG: SGNH/GDSL hydrolase family protein [Armatimonadota bacterium]|nr:SGNH/GDSL hydrolase family protein [Armatimonadota bacterium]
MMARWAWPWMTVASLAMGAAGADDRFEPPVPPESVEEMGRNIQRTMTLLATSTPQRRNRVRVLFYGQSVTRNPWWEDVADYLRERFPHADLEIENRAIGGYSAPTLIKTAEYDLYPSYPDLLIFHVWGGVESGEQEEIIRRTRQRTTAEVLLWTSNLRWPRDVPPDGDPNDPQVQRVDAADQAISDLYFRLGEEYGCEVADVRTGMQQYLAEHDLVVKDTIRDTVHPNELGNFLIAELIKPYLHYDPSFPTEPWEDLVEDVPVDDERVTRAEDGSLSLTFEGNRIDVIAAHTDEERLGSARVLIDGRPPSQFPELYYHARPSFTPVAGRPAINRIDHQAPLVVETWTASILECDPEEDILRYEVSGSETGPDGAGDHKERFVSDSGRVVIEPNMWMVNWSLRYREATLPEDYQATWQVKPLFVDTYKAPVTDDPAREYATTLAQGLSNARHTVTLTPAGDGRVPVAAFRVYRPPLQ